MPAAMVDLLLVSAFVGGAIAALLLREWLDD